MTRRAITVVVIPLLFVIPGVGPQAKAETIEYRTFAPGYYQSVIRKWDSTEHQVLYALIRNRSEWDAVFAPRGFGYQPRHGQVRQPRPFGPEKKDFEKEYILLIARASSDEDDLQVESVVANGEQLVLSYKVTAVSKEASRKRYVGVMIPKRECKEALFVENGASTGVLNVAKGEWCVPAIATPPKQEKTYTVKYYTPRDRQTHTEDIRTMSEDEAKDKVREHHPKAVFKDIELKQ